MHNTFRVSVRLLFPYKLRTNFGLVFHCRNCRSLLGHKQYRRTGSLSARRPHHALYFFCLPNTEWDRASSPSPCKTHFYHYYVRRTQKYYSHSRAFLYRCEDIYVQACYPVRVRLNTTGYTYVHGRATSPIDIGVQIQQGKSSYMCRSGNVAVYVFT